MKKIVSIASSIALAIIVSGCSQNIADPKPLTKKSTHLSLPHYINVQNKKTISQILSELQQSDRKIYMLDSKSKDIQIPTNEVFQFDTFEKFKQYVDSVTEYTISITKNKYRKGTPRIITVKPKFKKIVKKKIVKKKIVKIPLSEKEVIQKELEATYRHFQQLKKQGQFKGRLDIDQFLAEIDEMLSCLRNTKSVVKK